MNTTHLSTMLMLDCVLKQARELRVEVQRAELHAADAGRFQRALSEIEAQALKLFSRLV